MILQAYNHFSHSQEEREHTIVKRRGRSRGDTKKTTEGGGEIDEASTAPTARPA